MRMINLIRKDLLQVFRDKNSAIFLLLMPLAFTLFMGFINAPADTGDPRLKIGILNRDAGGTLSSSLEQSLSTSNVIDPEELLESDASQIETQVENDTYTAVLIIPADFSGKILRSENPQMELVVDTTKPSGQLAFTAIHNVIGRWLGSVQAAILSSDALLEKTSLPDREKSIRDGIVLAQEAWQNPPVTLRVSTVTAGEVLSEAPSGFDQTSPGMIVQFSILGLITSAMVLVLERKNHCLQRMLTTPINRAGIIAGHMLAMSAITFIQVLILVIAGQLFFKVNYLNAPLATLLIIVALAMFIGCLGLLIGAIAKKEEQVILFSLIAMFLFTALGGAWFPLEGSSETFNAIGHFTPLAWVMDGFQNIILRGGGLDSALLPAGVLALYALVFFVLAVWRFKFE